jgi:hypothetical protein
MQTKTEMLREQNILLKKQKKTNEKLKKENKKILNDVNLQFNNENKDQMIKNIKNNKY